MNNEKTWYDEVKQDFIKNISDSYTLNLAMSVLEDRKSLLNENLKEQNNWNELKKWLNEEYEYCDKIGNPAIGCAMGQIKRTKNKMQELENRKV